MFVHHGVVIQTQYYLLWYLYTIGYQRLLDYNCLQCDQWRFLQLLHCEQRLQLSPQQAGMAGVEPCDEEHGVVLWFPQKAALPMLYHCHQNHWDKVIALIHNLQL